MFDGLAKALDPKKNGLAKALDPKKNRLAKALDPNQNGVAKALDPKKNGLAKALDPNQNGVAKALDPNQNGLAKGLELERLKSERYNLKEDINDLNKFCHTLEEQMTLQSNLAHYLNQLNETVATLEVIKKGLIKPENTKIENNTEGITNEKLDIPSFDGIYNIDLLVEKNIDDIKTLTKIRDDTTTIHDDIDKLQSLSNLEKTREEIKRKESRIDRINDRLKVIRSSN